MKIDLSCPAEILRAEPPKADQPYGVLTLFNLSDRSVVSCEATFRLTDREGNETGRTVHRARALTGRPHTAFTMTLPMEPDPTGVQAEATLDKVWFEDNDVWRRTAGNETEYISNALPPGNSLNALKFAAGENAVGFPSQQAGLWICVCGRPNSNRDTVCVRCLRQKDMIFSRYNRAEVEKILAQRERQLDLKSRSAREEDIRLQRIREEEYNLKKQRSSRQKHLLAAFLCALALTAAVLLAGLPALRLLSASVQMEDGQYEQAQSILTKLGSFPGAEKMLTDCENRIARRDAENSEDPEILQRAAGQLRSRGEGDADLSLADSADFSRASILLKAGQAEEAEALLLTLPENYPGRTDQLKACAYLKATESMAAREYDAARKILLSLGDYRDAESLAKSCLYEPALTLMESGDYDGAIALLEQIKDYEDSAALIRKSFYLKGFVLENAGETEAAREAYLAAGDYEDARERASSILMVKADNLTEQKDYAAALPLYQSLDGYADAREKWYACAVALAGRCIKDREYQQAISVLDALPEQTKESTSLLNKALYLAAKAAAKKEEYEEALLLLERIPDYQDAKTLLRNWRYALAQRLMEAEQWADAIPLLEEIGNYRHAVRWLTQAQEALAAAEAASASDTEAADAGSGKTSPSADGDILPNEVVTDGN